MNIELQTNTQSFLLLRLLCSQNLLPLPNTEVNTHRKQFYPALFSFVKRTFRKVAEGWNSTDSGSILTRFEFFGAGTTIKFAFRSLPLDHPSIRTLIGIFGAGSAIELAIESLPADHPPVGTHMGFFITSTINFAEGCKPNGSSPILARFGLFGAGSTIEFAVGSTAADKLPVGTLIGIGCTIKWRL